MEAECPLTIWCSAMTSSPPVGTYCLFPHNNVKRQTESHTAFLNCNIIYWRLDDTGELLSEQQTDASLSGGRWAGRLCSVNVRLFIFLTHALVAVRSCTSKTSTAGVHSAQITAVWLVTCHVALKTKKAASCDTAELSTVNSGIQPNHQPFTKSDAWWEKWPGLIPSGLQNGKFLKW